VFDASSGFGGYRESGFGREGGREGLWEYVKPAWEENERAAPQADAAGSAPASSTAAAVPRPGLDRTAKLYIGGRQVRPDQRYSLPVTSSTGEQLGEVGRGNRKDVRNAVEAARAAAGWTRGTAHARAQVLYYIAENLEARAGEFAQRLAALTGRGPDRGRDEVDRSIERLFAAAAWADKWDGAVHHTPFRNVTLAMPEPLGVIAVVCTDVDPLLGLVSAFAPAIAMGNTVVVVPSQAGPLAATDLYQVIDTSDVPAGVVNIITGLRAELTETLAAHDDVDGMWYFPADGGGADVERLSASNMKRTWVAHARERDWWDPRQGEPPEFLRHATQIKNIWVPYGE